MYTNTVRLRPSNSGVCHREPKRVRAVEVGQGSLELVEVLLHGLRDGRLEWKAAISRASTRLDPTKMYISKVVVRKAGVA